MLGLAPRTVCVRSASLLMRSEQLSVWWSHPRAADWDGPRPVCFVCLPPGCAVLSVPSVFSVAKSLCGQNAAPLPWQYLGWLISRVLGSLTFDVAAERRYSQSPFSGG